MGSLSVLSDPSGWTEVIKCTLNNHKQQNLSKNSKAKTELLFAANHVHMCSYNDGFPAFATFNFFCCLLSSPPERHFCVNCNNVVKIHPRNTVQDLVGQTWTTSLSLIPRICRMYSNVVKWILVVSSTHSLAFVHVHIFSFYLWSL